MNATISRFLTAIITICIMFSPILGYVDSLNREAVEVTLTEGAKKAAIEGRFTPEIIQEMKDNLSQHYNFDPNKITIKATTTLTPRNQYIEGTITVPRGILFVFNIFNQGPSTITKHTKVLSEYIN